MSKRIHTTMASLKGLTKTEIKAQAIDPDSDLATLAKKSNIKDDVKTREKILRHWINSKRNPNYPLNFKYLIIRQD